MEGTTTEANRPELNGGLVQSKQARKGLETFAEENNKGNLRSFEPKAETKKHFEELKKELESQREFMGALEDQLFYTHSLRR